MISQSEWLAGILSPPVWARSAGKEQPMKPTNDTEHQGNAKILEKETAGDSGARADSGVLWSPVKWLAGILSPPVWARSAGKEQPAKPTNETAHKGNAKMLRAAMLYPVADATGEGEQRLNKQVAEATEQRKNGDEDAGDSGARACGLRCPVVPCDVARWNLEPSYMGTIRWERAADEADE